jgi:putative addiction module killer protein
MYEIETTEEFDAWLIRTMSLGTLGKVRSLGGGLFEAKIDYGQGFRLYFVNKGQRIIVLLCGGSKPAQSRDIKQARKLAQEM